VLERFENAPHIGKSGSSVYVLPEYRVLMENKKAYQLLFRYRFSEGVCNLSRLSNLIGCRDVSDVSVLIGNLEGYLRRVMGGEIRGDLLELVCPDCFELSLVNFGRDGDEIKRTCSACGTETLESCSEDFDDSIEMGSTYAPESKLSVTKGLGGTLNHKKYLHVLLHDYNVPFDKFAEFLPGVAEMLLAGAYEVEFEGFVYHLMENSGQVRRVSVDDRFDATQKLWHSFDKPLRKTLAHLSSATYNELKGVLDYGEQICDHYGLKHNVTSDQIFRNTLGCDIRSLRPQLKSQHKSVPAKRLVETLFYKNLLIFKKTEIAALAKPNLEIDHDLINYYDAYSEFLSKHSEPNNSTSLLDSMESICLKRGSGGVVV
jgi:hypothetical protein